MKSYKDKETVETIIGPHAFFEGTLSSDRGIRIDGKVKGKIECKSSLIIGNKGMVEAEIVVEEAFIAGELSGTILAGNRVTITEEGKVYGDIETPKLVIDRGVIFEGKCHMVSNEEGLEHPNSPSRPIPVAGP